MEIREHPNVFEKFPREAVVEWLGHPVTEALRDWVKERERDMEAAAVSFCLNDSGGPLEQSRAKSLAIGLAIVAIRQLDCDIFGKAESYVKA